MDNIKIKIDGQEISVPKDFTVLDAINHNKQYDLFKYKSYNGEAYLLFCHV